MDNRTFATADDNTLNSVISNAQNRVVFVAPGLSTNVARSLISAKRRNLPKGVTVILDVDAEVCRLGYGEIEAMELLDRELKFDGSRILHQPGIRIGLLIADDTTLIFSPIPLLVEETSSQKPNAIILGVPAPSAVAEACGLANDITKQEIGLDFSSEAKLESVKSDLKANPPKPVNLARIERIFTSELHYVEFEITKYQLQSRKISVPSDLLGFTDDFLKKNIENTFKPFDGEDLLTVEIDMLDSNGKPIPGEKEKFSPKEIDRERKGIKDDLLSDIPGFGVVLRIRDKEEFESRAEMLKKKMELYSTNIKDKIEKMWEAAREKFVVSIIERIVEKPPTKLRKRTFGNNPTEIEAREYIEGLLNDQCKKIVGTYAPSAKWIYKDVTFHSIDDPSFRMGLESAFGAGVVDRLFHKYDAVPEKEAGR